MCVWGGGGGGRGGVGHSRLIFSRSSGVGVVVTPELKLYFLKGVGGGEGEGLHV